MHTSRIRLLLVISLLSTTGLAHAGSASSDFPVFWVAGDPTTIGMAFKFIAAMFGNGSLSQSVMAGGLLAASTMGLAMAIAASAFKQQFLIGQWFVGTLVAMFLFTPTTTVTVMSFFDETAAVVSPRSVVIDNIPVGIAYPAGVASYAAKAMSDKFITWFSTGDSDAQTTGASGLMNPLKMLLSMRDIYNCKNPGDSGMLCKNLAAYMQLCPDLDSRISNNAPVDAGLTTILNDSTVLGYTEWHTYSPTSSGSSSTSTDPIASGASEAVTYVPCREAGPKIYTAMTNYFSSLQFGSDLARGISLSSPGAATSGSAEGDSSAAAAKGQAVLSQLKNSLIDTKLQENDIGAALVMHRITAASIAARQSDTPLHAAETFTKTMAEARNRAALDQATQGSMFVSFMTTAMNAFSFIFAGTACLVILLAVVSGFGGLRIYGSWLLFGFWTQSWLPIATLVSYYTDASFWQRVTDLAATSQLSMLNIDKFYDQVINVIYTGSVMMSSVPILTFSLLSGSAVAMTSLAGKATGTDRDYGDAAQFGGVDTAKDANVAEALKKHTESGVAVTASTGADTHSLVTPNAATGMAKVNMSDGYAQKESQITAASQQVQKAHEHTRQSEAALEHAKAEESKLSVSAGDNTRVSSQAGNTQQTSSSTGGSTTAQHSNDVSHRVEGGFGANLMGAKAGVSVSSSDTDSIKNQNNSEHVAKTGTSVDNSASQEGTSSINSAVSSSSRVQSAQREVEVARVAEQQAVSYQQSLQQSLEHIKSSDTGMTADVGSLVPAAYMSQSVGETTAQMKQEAAYYGGQAGAEKLEQLVQQNGGEANWSKEIAVGNAITAGLHSKDPELHNAALGATAALAAAAGQQAMAGALQENAGFTRMVLDHDQAHARLRDVTDGSKTVGQAFGDAGFSARAERPSGGNLQVPGISGFGATAQESLLRTQYQHPAMAGPSHQSEYSTAMALERAGVPLSSPKGQEQLARARVMDTGYSDNKMQYDGNLSSAGAADAKQLLPGGTSSLAQHEEQTSMSPEQHQKEQERIKKLSDQIPR